MKATDVKFLARAAGASLRGNADAVAFGVKIDSRECSSGDMFVCVIGERDDGHKYTMDAYERGCRIFLMSDEWRAVELIERDPEATVMLVEDSAEGFKRMAAAYIERFPLRKVAITGSVGKTSTKSYTAAILAERYNVVSSQKNLNTHLGICLTCFQADETTEIAVFEMGMDRPGEIGEYVDWVFPETGVITYIGTSHLEKLGSRDAIAEGKLQIVKNFSNENVLIYNSDSDYLSEAEIARRTGGEFRMFSVGSSEHCDLRVRSLRACESGGISFALEHGISRQVINMPVLGTHNAINAALAAAVGLVYGVDLEAAAKALSEPGHNPRRLELHEIAGVLLIDDSYNASPESMKAALDAFDKLRAERKIAILADMLELGSGEQGGHEAVGIRIASSTVDKLYAIGPRAKTYVQPASYKNDIQIIYSEKLEMVEDRIMRDIGPGDAVLIKGSNITGVADLAQRLKAELRDREEGGLD